MQRFYAPLIALMLILATAPALAQISRDEAAATAQRMAGGRVLSVDKARAGGREVYRVKVLTPSGEVRVISVNAETGAAE